MNEEQNTTRRTRVHDGHTARTTVLGNAEDTNR